MKYETKMLILAIIIVSCFIATAIVISYRNYGLMALFFFSGLALMGYGFKLKSEYQRDEQ
ncbi:DUF5325 family protein [Alkalibacillus sp. S2W]|uniref:Membrane protein n=1 Tax=Alkalibacillus salilacus TaxID=284582 RepID=A0ABT9VGQ5_9BACI|nr:MULTISPECIES: DUF5325 family protein [Alkalibacillus]MDQ0160099.1 putative membrane protein [Alkalibacillus salilacus]NIK10647.1 putative membrane protein [Alkalibacillus almallahensis]